MPGKQKKNERLDGVAWKDGPRGGQYRTERVAGEERKVYRRKPKSERAMTERPAGNRYYGYGGYGLPLAATALALGAYGPYGYGPWW